jgi:hypothetical protein
MARYWVYLDDKVSGPYGVEQLIRLRGFSRQTQVCVDDSSGKPTQWISPAEIPELAHIFKAVDERQTLMPSAAPAKAQPKPATPRTVTKPAGPAVVLKAPPSAGLSTTWPWWLIAALLAGASLFTWLRYIQRNALAQEQVSVKSLVEKAPLPSSSLYATLSQYINEKGLQPRWEFERTPDGLYNVSLSWYQREGSTVYAFEVNSQAQTVRGLNTAAIKLLSEGFLPPPSARPKPAPVKKKSPSESFAGTLDTYRQAVEAGEFQTVWDSFSARKKAEMAKGGMSHDGFIRLQNLTFKVDSPAKQAILKTIDESETQKLVLLKQSQSGRPDIFVKQVWIYQDDEWKLDDEQKRSAAAPTSALAQPPATAPAAAPSSNSGTPSAPSGKPAPASLPGMSN